MTCDAKIRPLPDDTEISCELEADGHESHEGILRGRAGPGSQTKITWMEVDRRTYHGDWPGTCNEVGQCPLPTGHHGRHALSY